MATRAASNNTSSGKPKAAGTANATSDVVGVTKRFFCLINQQIPLFETHFQ